MVAATAHTPYSLASVTKAITGTAVTVLASRGRLDLDRPINAYLGRAKVRSRLWDADDATVRRIANHTAGLTTYARDCETARDCAIDETIRRYAIVVRPSGAGFDYSNLGYAILGDVVARVSGRTYVDLLRNALRLWRMGDEVGSTKSGAADALRSTAGGLRRSRGFGSVASSTVASFIE